MVPVGSGSDVVSVAMHWDGIQWNVSPSLSPSPAPGLGYTTFYAVDGTSSSNLWAAGGQIKQLAGGWVGTQLMVQHFDGNQWTLMNTPDPFSSLSGGVSGAHVRDVEAIAEDEAWFAGDWIALNPQTWFSTVPGLLMRLKNGSFTIFDVPIVTSAGAGQGFESISAVSATDIWAVGGGGDGDWIDQSIIFHFDGSAWSYVPGPSPGWFHRLFAVEAISSADVWATGQYQDPSGIHTLLIHWDGSSWTQVAAPGGSLSLKAFASNDVYMGGGGIYHFDGVAWTQVEPFASVDGPSILDLDASGPCQLYAVGRQFTVGEIQNFSARIDHAQYWHAGQRSGCIAGSTPAWIQAFTPPKLGAVMTVGTDDPSNGGGLAPLSNGASYWFVSAAPAGDCGLVLPFGGAAGGAGELLVDPASIVATFGPAPWSSPGVPAIHLAAVPSTPALAGVAFASQGVLIDVGGVTPKLVFTPALDFTIGF